MSSILFFVNALSQKVCLDNGTGHNVEHNVKFGNGRMENNTIIYEDGER